VIHQARVSVHSRDRPRRVYARWDGSRIEAQVRAWSIERSDRATGSAHEAVIHAVCVREHSRNNSSRIDADGEGSPILARARAGSIEKGNRAAGGAHEAVSYIATACEDAESRDGPRLVDADAAGALKRARACTRTIKGGENGPAVIRRFWGTVHSGGSVLLRNHQQKGKRKHRCLGRQFSHFSASDALQGA